MDRVIDLVASLATLVDRVDVEVGSRQVREGDTMGPLATHKTNSSSVPSPRWPWMKERR